MSLRYIIAAVLRRPAETVAATVAIAVTVPFFAALGSFTAHTGSELTLRASARVPVDWQVQVTPGSDPATARQALTAVPGLAGFRAVDYAKVPGLRSVSPSTGTRTTGAAWVVALP